MFPSPPSPPLTFPPPECQYTVKDLLEKAAAPQRVSVGICFQYDEETDAELLEHFPTELFQEQVIDSRFHMKTENVERKREGRERKE